MHGVRRCRSKPFPPFRGSAYQSPTKSTGTFSRSSNHRTWARSFEAAAASTGDVLNDIARASHRRNSAIFASAKRATLSASRLRQSLFASFFAPSPPAPRAARASAPIHHPPPRTAAGARRPLPPDPVPRVARARYLPRARPRARVPPPSARVPPSARRPPRAPPPFPAYSLPHRRRLGAPRPRPRAAVATASTDRAAPPRRIPRRRSRPIRSRRASSRRRVRAPSTARSRA